MTFAELLIVFSTKIHLLYLLYSTVWRCFLLYVIKQNCLRKTFLITLILTQVSLYLFFLRTTTCIQVVVLRNCEPELSYTLAELFNKCLKKLCFPNCWKVLSVIPLFKDVGERSTAKNYRPVRG